MLHWALVFFVLALVALLFGFGGVAVASASIARLFFYGFVILTLASLLLDGRWRRPR